MTTCPFPLRPKARNAAASNLMRARQRTLDQLYSRRETLENLIRALELYDENVQRVASKVVALR